MLMESEAKLARPMQTSESGYEDRSTSCRFSDWAAWELSAKGELACHTLAIYEESKLSARTSLL